MMYWITQWTFQGDVQDVFYSKLSLDIDADNFGRPLGFMRCQQDFIKFEKKL